jgi:uncharacterized protein (TIGR03086 family)
MSVQPFTGASASTAAILANVSQDQLDLPTPCASWTVRDLINHVVGNAFWFEAIADNGVAPDRPDNCAPDFTGGDFKTTFTEGSGRATAAFDAALDKTLQLPWGAMPATAFLMMASADQFVHGWDLAKATGQSTDLAADLAAQFLEFYRQVMSDPFRGPDTQAPFGAAVRVPESAGTATQLAAFLGRTP